MSRVEISPVTATQKEEETKENLKAENIVNTTSKVLKKI